MTAIHIIEDDPLQADMLVDRLVARFPFLRTFVSPSLAHFAAHAGGYDVLISDLSLPDSSPADTAEFLLGLPRNSIVVCFSSDQPVGEDLARASGNRIQYFNKAKGTSGVLYFVESVLKRDKDAVSKKSQQPHGH
ncbi:MAG TPA: response regulator [Limnobacter sp.]|nr:response regulator [Limnobacter sp.]